MDLNILKEVLYAYSCGNSSAPRGEYWQQDIFWGSILNEYYVKAREANLTPQSTIRAILDGGVDLQSAYCLTRGTPEADCRLTTIFDPCRECKLRVVSIPKRSELTPPENIRKFSNDELEVLKSVLLGYANHNFGFERGAYQSISFWNNLLQEYNLRVSDEFKRVDARELIKGGDKIRRIFNKERKAGVISSDLKRIFERCEACRHRIPVFPTTLNSQSRSFSHSGGSGGAASTSMASFIQGNNNASTSSASMFYSPDVKAKVRAEITTLYKDSRITAEETAKVLNTICWNGKSDNMIQTLISPDLDDDVKTFIVKDELAKLSS